MSRERSVGMTRSIEELPGPRGLPLIGVAHRVRPKSLHLSLESWSEQYGPVYGVDLGGRRVVVIADSDAANEALRERPNGFRRPRRGRSVWKELVGSVGVFAAEGSEWKQQRRLAVTALNSNHLQRYYEIVRTCTERLHGRLTRTANGQGHDVGLDLTSFTVDVTSALAFGHDLNTLEHGDGELQRDIQRIFLTMGRRITMPFRYWRYLRLPADHAADRSAAAIENEIETFVAQARTRMAARPQLYEQPENLLETMIAAQASDDTFTDAEIVGNIYTMLLAGEDTTAHTMAWTLWLLASYPEIQRRWAAEADRVLGAELFPGAYEQVGELRYGEAVLRESMRLKPVAPVIVLEALVDTLLAGTRIPSGTVLFLLTRSVGLRSVERAQEFDPDRWLGEDGRPGGAPDQRTFLAFGAGPRFCPGRNLAFLEAKAALAMIARNFEIELDQSAPPVNETFQFTMAPAGLRLRLTERDPERILA